MIQFLSACVFPVTIYQCGPVSALTSPTELASYIAREVSIYVEANGFPRRWCVLCQSRTRARNEVYACRARSQCACARLGYIAVASSPGFSLLPRNSLRMTFDPPERKAEGEPGPFSHVIDDA